MPLLHVPKKKGKKRGLSRKHDKPIEGPVYGVTLPRRAFQTLEKRDWVALLIIGLSTFLLYFYTLNYPFHFDDYLNIVENPYIKQLGNFSLFLEGLKANRTWHRALPTLSFALNYHFHGLKVWGYHLFNILLHLGSGILIYFISKQLLSLAWKKKETLGTSTIGEHFKDIYFPLFIALIFIVHPIQVNAVTYIAQRIEGMAGFFYLLSFFFFMKGSFSKGLSRGLFFGGAGLAFLSAIFSKEIGFTLPVVIMVFDLLFVCKDRSEVKKRLWIYGPILLLLTLFILFFLREGIYTILFRQTHFWTPWENLLTQTNVLIQYFKLLLFPWPGWLNIDHEFDVAKSVFEYPTFFSILALMGLIFFSILWLKKNRLFTFSILWFFIVLAPTSSLIPIWDIMVEYRLYVPMFAYGLILSMMIGFIWRQVFSQYLSYKITSRALLGAMVFILLIYSTFTIQRNLVFKDGMSLWQDALKKSPNKIRPYLNVGAMYHRDNRNEEAIKVMKKALEKEPKDYYLVHFNIGVVFSEMGDYEKAMVHLQKALNGDPRNPKIHQEVATLYLRRGDLEKARMHFEEVLKTNPYLGPAHAGLGEIYARQGKLNDAIQLYQHALRLEPDLTNVHVRLGEAYAKVGKIQEALLEIEKAMKMNPNSQEAHASLGAIYLQEGRAEEAIPLLKSALSTSPKNPEIYNNLGVAHRLKGELDEAIRYYRMAIEIDPKFIDAHINLGESYFRKGITKEAIAEYQKAVSLDPQRPEPHNHLGVLYLKKGRIEEAILHLSKAVSLQPEYGEAHYNLGLAYYQKREVQKALKQVEKAIQLGYPVNPKLLQLLSSHR